MGCGASSAKGLHVDVEARDGCDRQYDDLVAESPTLSNAFEKPDIFWTVVAPPAPPL